MCGLNIIFFLDSSRLDCLEEVLAVFETFGCLGGFDENETSIC